MKKALDALYRFFSSVKLAIVILIALAATSIIGTIIEQQANPEKYLQEYGQFTYKIFKFLGFTNVYHSWWYILLLVLLGINLTVCSIERLPKIWKIAMHPKKKLPEGAEKSLKVAHSITLSAADPLEVAKKIADKLKKLGYKSEVIDSNRSDEYFIFGDKHVFARFGVYIVHAGIIVVLIGALITAIFGYRGYMNIAEGGKTNLAVLFGSGEIKKFPFYIRCDKFEIEYYPSGMPKKYISYLSVIENGKIVKRKRIVVNEPLYYKGVYFYQASYGPTRGFPFATRYYFFVKKNPSAKPSAHIVAFEQPLEVANNTYIMPKGNMGQGRVLIYITNSTGKAIYQAMLKTRVWYKAPGKNQAFVAIGGFDRGWYTGLQVSYDPGTAIVWIGSTILVFGLFVAFFTSHRRVLGRVKKIKDGKVKLVIGGRSSKGTEGLIRDLEEVVGVVKSLYCSIGLKEEKNDSGRA